MSKLLFINNEEFYVKIDEYNNEQQKFSNLKIFEKLGLHERLIELFKKLRKCFIYNCSDIDYLINLIIYDCTHGGYIPIKLNKNFKNIYINCNDETHLFNINKNIDLYKTNNINHDQFNDFDEKSIFFIPNEFEEIKFYSEYFKTSNVIIVSVQLDILDKSFKYKYSISNTYYFVYLNDNEIFLEVFKYYLNFKTNTLFYDNLINLCIMVKNAGDIFEKFLNSNIHLIDKWTILDTGSTDNTIQIINKILVGKKDGELYQETFINFKDSRNRLLELAGETCKFTIMLDDTYFVMGDLREFLNFIRGDQYSSSLSIFINTNDVRYSSNRILKSSNKLRYIYKIHEVVNDKNNIIVNIPYEIAYIIDETNEHMKTRSKKRLQLDLELLYEELEEDKNNPRTYYYLGQTYNLLGDYINSFKFYMKRYEFYNCGLLQERFSAILRSARIANYQLNIKWEECEDLFLKAYKIDETRPEPLYFIGLHYYLLNNNIKAFDYFVKAFNLGVPLDSQFDIILDIYYHFIPLFLTKISYSLDQYQIGEKASELFLNYDNNKKTNEYAEIISWNLIYKKLNIYKGSKQINLFPSKPIFCFVADGGFKPWSGSDIIKNGVGGSETYIIEMARNIQKSGLFQTYVFSNTLNNQEEIFEDTIYKPLSSYYEFVNTTHIQHCMVSRFSEYLPVSFKGWTENIYFVIHDLTPSGIVIPIDNKLKKIFCLTEWHVEYFTSFFPKLKHLTVPFYYGCSFNENENENENKNNKIPYSFIYSSFPNRGLLELLQMWPEIYNNQPKVTLNIYSDVDNKWSNDVEPIKMQNIKKLLNEYKSRENGLGINYHGWVNKSTLRKAWETADIWFYPCTFKETFCLTALEAASSKTFVITNDLAALQNTVGDRGIIIKGDAITDTWKKYALKKILYFFNVKNNNEKKTLIDINYNWSKELTWNKQAKKLLNEYILENNLHYKNKFDLVPNNLETIESNKVLDYFILNNPNIKNNKEIKILDINTHTGTNLIYFIKKIPGSIGLGIDSWDNIILNNNYNNNLESSFKLNIINSNVENKIEFINSNVISKLLNLIRDCKKFDFIYIGFDIKTHELYTLILLAWKLLNSFGILGISYNDQLEKILNQFINDFKPKYKLINLENKVWIEKI